MRKKVNVEIDVCDICQEPDNIAGYDCVLCKKWFCEKCRKIHLNEFETLTGRPGDIKMIDPPRVVINICDDCFKEPPEDAKKMIKWIEHIKKLHNRVKTSEKRFYELYDKSKAKYR